jgi:hypothetical protein
MGFVKSPIYLPQVDLGLHAPLCCHHRPLSSPSSPRASPLALHAPEREVHTPKHGSHAQARVPHAPGSSLLLHPPSLDCPPLRPFLYLHRGHDWFFVLLLYFRVYLFCVFMYFSVVFCCFYFTVVLFGLRSPSSFKAYICSGVFSSHLVLCSANLATITL